MPLRIVCMRTMEFIGIGSCCAFLREICKTPYLPIGLLGTGRRARRCEWYCNIMRLDDKCDNEIVCVHSILSILQCGKLYFRTACAQTPHHVVPIY